MQSDLIYDVGMHTGNDTDFYLKKGFRVVAVEANPDLIRQCQICFSAQIESGNLKIYPVAISSQNGQVDFFVNRQKDDWGTISEEFARRNEKLGRSSDIIAVPSMRFEQILKEDGMPYYLKIDIEGADHLCLEALHHFDDRPRFISVESGLLSFDETFTELSHLWSLGYRKFKIVNQALNNKIKCPNPPLEGKYVDAYFDGLSSGTFGEEAPGKWMGAEETFDRYRAILREQTLFGTSGKYYGTRLMKYYLRFKKFTHQDPIGWFDFHARLGD